MAKLPRLPHSSHPDYISKLEEGLDLSQELLLGELYRSIVKDLRTIPGVTVNAKKEVKSMEDIVELEDRIEINSEDETAVHDQMYKILLKYEEFWSEEKKINSRITKIKERAFQFQNALLDLTEVSPLRPVDPQYEHAHLYALRESNIYENCSNTGQIMVREFETFEEMESFLGKVAIAMEKDTNIYKVTNPSEQVPAEYMLERANQKIFGN